MYMYMYVYVLGVLTLEHRVRRCVASCGVERGGCADKLDQQNARRTRNATLLRVRVRMCCCSLSFRAFRARSLARCRGVAGASDAKKIGPASA